MFTAGDHAPESQWRHLDTMQFETRIKAALPRVNCPTCSIKTTTAPWAEKHSRFTLMYKAFAIAVLQACGYIKQAATYVTSNLIVENSIEHFSQANFPRAARPFTLG